jgi:hypothetical protein
MDAAARDIDLYVKDPETVDVDLGRYTDRVKVHPLSSRKVRPGPVIMVRETRRPPVLMDLESPHEVELEVADPNELDGKEIERFVEAVDEGDHKLSIVQVEQKP